MYVKNSDNILSGCNLNISMNTTSYNFDTLKVPNLDEKTVKYSDISSKLSLN